MKSILTALATVLLFISCTKHSISVKPQARFFFGDTDTTAIIGTHDELHLYSYSIAADSVNWNLGNGKIMRGDLVIFSYDSAGTYKVSLTAYGKNGITSTVSRTVTVKERVLKSFSINDLHINKFALSQNGLPVFTNFNLWLQVKFSHSNTDTFTSNGDMLVPVVYSSPVFANIDSSFHSSINFTLNSTDKVVIPFPINNVYYQNVGRGLLINLYGQDNSGTYLLASSGWTGRGNVVVWYGPGNVVLNYGNPALSSHYALTTYAPGSLTQVVLNCEYE